MNTVTRWAVDALNNSGEFTRRLGVADNEASAEKFGAAQKAALRLPAIRIEPIAVQPLAVWPATEEV